MFILVTDEINKDRISYPRLYLLPKWSCFGIFPPFLQLPYSIFYVFVGNVGAGWRRAFSLFLAYAYKLQG